MTDTRAAKAAKLVLALMALHGAAGPRIRGRANESVHWPRGVVSAVRARGGTDAEALLVLGWMMGIVDTVEDVACMVMRCRGTQRRVGKVGNPRRRVHLTVGER